MAFTLGIDVGASCTVAAVSRLDGTRWTGARPVRLVAADTEAPVLARVGDGVPIVLGNRAHSAHELAVAGIARMVDEVATEERARPERVVVTHPSEWGPYRTDLLREALRATELANAVVVPEAVAAAVGAASRHRIDSTGLVGVYDLGGSRVTASVLRRAGSAGFELVGRPESAEHSAGTDFDDALLAMVTTAQTGTSWDTMAQLRRDCVAAKQALSTLPEVMITPRHGPVTRADFEALILPVVNQGVEVLMRAVASAGVTPEQLSVIVLVGGSSRIPLVRRVITDRLRRPVLVDQAPDATVAMGAATIATWSVPGQVDKSAPVEQTVVMARLTEETVILFPPEDLDLSPQPEPDEQPARPPVDVPSPDLGPPPRPRKRRRRNRMTVRGAVIGGGTALLLVACAWLVQQYLSATPPPAPPAVTTTTGTGGR